VASYVYSYEQVPLENYANEIISHAIPALGGVGPRSLDYKTPVTASMTEMQPLGSCLEPIRANLKASEICAATNGLDQGSMPSKLKAPTTSSGMTSTINDDTLMSVHPSVKSESRLSLSTADSSIHQVGQRQ
jgi:hypothetical protein